MIKYIYKDSKTIYNPSQSIKDFMAFIFCCTLLLIINLFLFFQPQVDIDLNDPEVGKAAVKIQAGFKNFMANKKKPGCNNESSQSKPACMDLKNQAIDYALVNTYLFKIKISIIF